MKHILVTTPFLDEQKGALLAAVEEAGNTVTFADGGTVSEEEIASADAIIGNLSGKQLAANDHLEWVQLFSSGAAEYAQEGVLPKETILTSATGAFGHAISEYMVGMLLAMMKRIPAYMEDQKAHVWRSLGKVESPMDKRILIVGCGNIGMEFARRIAPFGGMLVGVRRRPGEVPEGFAEMHGIEDLAEEVAKADVIALSLPGTEQTYHLFDRDMLCRCKEGAYLMNVGRGTVIDTKAICDPEVAGRFAGIWMDVFEEEPLPANDPLYDIPHVYITPHITGFFHLKNTLEYIFGITMENLRVYQTGEGAYRSVVDRATGYCQ